MNGERITLVIQTLFKHVYLLFYLKVTYTLTSGSSLHLCFIRPKPLIIV